MFRLAAAIIFSTLSISSFGQTISIKGIVAELEGKTPIAGATVSLLLKQDSSVVKNVVSDNKGRFFFGSINKEALLLKVKMSNFQESISVVSPGNNGEVDMGIIGLVKKVKDLAEITVISKASPVIQKGDTSQFSASQYKVNPDATTEDLIKKMPGITVDKNGTVTAQGEQVKKITIDGKDFFGDDASAALKNIPSEVVDKIQVFDRLSDQAQLTGFDDGNSQKSINIITKTGIKNGQFGRAYVGLGTDERYAGGGNVSFFKGDRRLSIVSNFNNINQQNFGSQDLLGVTSSGNSSGGSGGSRGGSRGSGGGYNSGSDNFTVGQSNGVSKTNALGINFSNQYGKKLTVSGSYFYNDSKNTNASVLNTEIFAPTGKNLFSDEAGNALTTNSNHRINLRMEYKLNPKNSFFFIPSINFQDNNYSSLMSNKSYYGVNDSASTSGVNNLSKRNGYNIRNNMMYRHSFDKKGRSLSLGFSSAFTKNDGDGISYGAYRFFRSNLTVYDSLQNQQAKTLSNGQTYSGNLSYTEPLGKKSQLQIEYNPTVQKNKSDQETFLYDGLKYSLFDSTLSNKFDNTVTTNRGGVTYRYTPNRDDMFSFGINIQNSNLKSDRVFPSVSAVNQSFFDWLPNAMWRKKLSAASNIRLFYRASVNFPSVSQLQDVLNASNPLRMSIGNPSLKQSNTQFLATRYSYTNTKTSKSFFANLYVQTASNFVSNATYIASADSVIQQGKILNRNSQLVKPVNLDGYRSLRSFFTYSMPIKKIKTTLNVNTGFSYSKLPGMANLVQNKTDNYGYSAGAVLASNISPLIDFNINYTANFNTAKNSSNPSQNNQSLSQVSGLQLNLLNKKGWFIQNDLNNQTFTGLSQGLNQSFWLWNAAIGKKFLKNRAGELKLSVFDLLKQNQSISRNVTESYIQDTQTEVLKQYFMLTFTYNLKNFGVPKATKPSTTEEGHYGPSRMGGGGL
jgi:hypothetical protein